MGLVGQFIFAHSSMMAGLIFPYILYHDQAPWTADTRQIEFGSVINLSNCCNFFINFACLLYLREECGDVVHICYSNQILCIFCSYLVQQSTTMGLDVCKIYLGPVPKCSINVNYFITFVCL